MCGIAGIFNTDGQRAEEQQVKKMLARVVHRGPDGEGVYVEENLGLGHRRLSILDLSEKGKQPMQSHDTRWVISFNGCIYNYKELRAELQAKGHIFASTTDTEVISEGLSAWGLDFVKRMNGMFAVAAFDRKTKNLYLIRDRFGIKPLYYWFNGKKVLFASEIKSFFSDPDFSVSVDAGALNEYFTFQNLFTYRTLFKNVFLVPPANTIKIEKGIKEITHNPWWDYVFEEDHSISYADSVKETARLMEQAVHRQLAADVPVGSYLSGGMDSGSIAAIASKHIPRITTFTCGFDLSSVTGVEANYDERRDAELMANYIKSEHYEQVMNAGDLRWSLPRVVYHLEDLKVGMSYPNYYISRLASKFNKVCLQGTGGDELFGGYPWRYYRVFKSLNQAEFFDNYYHFWQRLVPDEKKNEFFTDNVRSQINIGEPLEIFKRVFTFNTKLRYDRPEEHINNSLYFEIKTFLPGLLMMGDKLAMANSLEERFPFLDNELVDFALKVPVKYKLGNFETLKQADENVFGNKKKLYAEFKDGKNILREAMSSFVPEQIINRNKQGFSAPDESWYRGENAEYVKELLLNPKAASLEFINKKAVEKIVDEHINHRINHRLVIWSLMNFEWWCRLFLNGEEVPN